MAKKKQKLKYKYQMSAQCRRPQEHQARFLKWINKNFRSTVPTVEQIVDAMLNGELKGLVERNVKKAAESWWRSEAQYYRRHVEVITIDVEIGKQVGQAVRAFIPVEKGQYGTIPEENYIPTKRIANDPSLSMSVVDQAMTDFYAWLNRYERYDEFFKTFSPVVQAFRKLERRLNKKPKPKKKGA